MSLSDRINDTNAAPWVIEEIRKLEAERDALASFRYRVAHYVFRYEVGHFDSQALADVMRVLNATKLTTTLAQLKAEWQAEALEQAAQDVAFTEPVKGMLRAKAMNAARQAEGGE